MKLQQGVRVDQNSKVAEAVVLLHGIFKTERSMIPVAEMLEENGYATFNIGYPSTQLCLDDLVNFLWREHLTSAFWQNAQQNFRTVHFVSHSMGGLLLRRYLRKYWDQIQTDLLGRVVMLGPPHGGSQIADLVKNIPAYKRLFGPAGQELTTKVRARVEDALPLEIGIIAGYKSWPHIFGGLVLPGKSDGRVAVEQTKSIDMTAHVTVSASHNDLMKNEVVLAQILKFLKGQKGQ